ncbi:hypothetical protein KFK09_012264 [Dendrobium nobile]|uniref:Uncharacterized protein n=1 Tax=Dendrobium nobile TaxID=94219 RepID=A0A8T3BGV9_DENNO|nr:hypothetical protein KFK09_012264 [Dendrobium nobile]
MFIDPVEDYLVLFASHVMHHIGQNTSFELPYEIGGIDYNLQWFMALSALSSWSKNCGFHLGRLSYCFLKRQIANGGSACRFTTFVKFEDLSDPHFEVEYSDFVLRAINLVNSKQSI